MGTVDSPLPQMLGRYALYEKIASGGMASVHIGRLLGPEGFSRTVAIKRMHPHVADDPEFVTMFLDEARIAARIRHPNVIPTLDVVSLTGELFLVMDFVHGDSLSRLIQAASSRGETIPPALVATIMAGVLHGLHAAHEAKTERGEPLEVVHRDVSPQNILVGVDGVARVLDFGVARAAGRMQTTRDGQLKGKLSYMAPEQLRGHVTRRSDVYSASVVLWEALAGRRLYAAENDGHLFDQVLKGCAEPPSQYARGVSPALDLVTMRGLEVDPTKRFASARDMACALEEAIALATASKLGAWVEVTAKTTLEARSARIARIESDSYTREAAAVQGQADARIEATRELDPSSVGPLFSVEESAGTQLSSESSVSVPERPKVPPATKRRPVWALAIGALFVLLAVSVTLTQRHAKSAGAPSPALSASASVVSQEMPPVAAPEAIPSAVSPAAEKPVDEAPTAAVTASARPPRETRGASSPVSTPRPSVRSSCDPPWSINGRGVRIFKPECL